MSKKYRYNVTVPITGSVMIFVETDKEIESAGEAFEKAFEAISEIDHYFCFGVPGDDKAHTEIGDMMMGDEIGHHKYLNRGNVCRAVCPETEWQLEESYDEDEEE